MAQPRALKGPHLKILRRNSFCVQRTYAQVARVTLVNAAGLGAEENSSSATEGNKSLLSAEDFWGRGRYV